MKPTMIIDEDGTKVWTLNGKSHREDGPAVEYPDGSKEWRINGNIHREDGPAVECAERKDWYINGKRHRVDGPAIEFKDGEKRWFINDEYIDLEQIIKNHPDGYGPWSSSDLAKLKLKYL